MPSGPIRRGLSSVGTVPSTMVRGMAAALLLALTAASCSALSTVAPHDAPAPVPSAGPWSVVCPRPQHGALQGCRAPIPLVVAVAGCGRLRLRGGAGATDGERTRDNELRLDGAADIAAGNHAPQPSAGLLLNKSKRLIEDHLLLKKKEKERAAELKRMGEMAHAGEPGGVSLEAGQGAGAGATELGDYQEERSQLEYDMDVCVTNFKARLLQLLDWRTGATGVAGDRGAGGEDGEDEEDEAHRAFDDWTPEDAGPGKKTAPEAPAMEKQRSGAGGEHRMDDASVEEGEGVPRQKEPPAHSRGGFACVLLDKACNVAFRLEPMRNQVDAAAWLAFHVVLEMFGVRAARSVAADRPEVVMMADRAMASNQSHVSWNDTAIVRCYQEPTLQAFSKHVLKHRNRLLRRSQERRSDNSHRPGDGGDRSNLRGGLLSAGSQADRAASHLLTPLAWFWHRVELPVLPEGDNDSITDNDRTRRVRGRELADLLCGTESGGERHLKGNPHGETRTVRLLCTVFDLGTRDLASASRSSWQSGAPPDVPLKVVSHVGRALRCMHACGIAHGDVKMANVVQVGDGFWLGDLPALTRATTKMLTNDPISSTLLVSGKRLLCNDMWGLGLITLSLLGGSAPFKRTCEKFKRILPPANAAPLWIIFAAGFLHTLAHLVPKEQAVVDAARAVRQLIQAPATRKTIKPISRDCRETCRMEGEQAARLIMRHPAAPKLWTQLAYCFDISNVARNALAMPLPGEELGNPVPLAL